MEAESLDLHGGFVANTDLGSAWDPTGRRIAVVVQRWLPDPSIPINYSTSLIVWDGSTAPIVKDLRIGPAGAFGAAWSSDGESISFTSGVEIIMLSGDDLQFEQRIDSFIESHVSQEQASQDEEESTIISTRGVTLTHGWSPNGQWLVSGNVGGLNFWNLGETVFVA